MTLVRDNQTAEDPPVPTLAVGLDSHLYFAEAVKRFQEARGTCRDTLSTIAAVRPGVDDLRDYLKRRELSVWRETNGDGQPVIDGKNENIRADQHRAYLEADTEYQQARTALRLDEVELDRLQRVLADAELGLTLAKERMRGWTAWQNARAARVTG